MVGIDFSYTKLDAWTQARTGGDDLQRRVGTRGRMLVTPECAQERIPWASVSQPQPRRRGKE